MPANQNGGAYDTSQDYTARRGFTAPQPVRQQGNVPDGAPSGRRAPSSGGVPNRTKAGKAAPNKRRNAKSPKPKKRRASREERKRRRRVIRGRLLMILALTVIFAGFVASYIFLSLSFFGDRISGQITYNILGVVTDEEKGTREKLYEAALPASKYIRDGIVYADMTFLADYFGYTVTGGGDEARFIDIAPSNASDVPSGFYAIFRDRSSLASVNGITVRLDGPVYFGESGALDSTAVYVPISFFERYTDGTECVWNEETRTLSFIRELLGYTVPKVGEASAAIFDELSITASVLEPCAAIDEDGLSEVVKYLTDPDRIAGNVGDSGLPSDGSTSLPDGIALP